MRIDSVPRAAVRSRTAKVADAAWTRASRMFEPDTRADTRSEAKRSPVPDGLIGSFGVVTRHAEVRSMASVSMCPSRVSAGSALVTTIVDGPYAESARAWPIIWSIELAVAAQSHSNSK